MFKKLSILSVLCALSLVIGACGGGGSSSGSGLAGSAGNNSPSFTSTPPTSAVEGQLYSYQATASDADGDILTWTLATSPSGMTMNGSGLVQWTPTGAQVGTHNVVIEVSDGTVSVTQSYTVTVTQAGGANMPPVITSSPPTTATEGQSYTYAAAASDPENDPLTWSLTTSPSGMTVNSGTGLVQWTPTNAQVGSHNVTLEVSDGQASAQQSWTITVSAASGGGTVGGTATNGSGGGTGTVNGSYQGRSYRLHVPSSYSQTTPSPLVIALHGGGDTYTNFHNTLAGSGWTSAANSNNFILMTPDNMNSSASSFLHLSGSNTLDAQGTASEINGVIQAAYYGAGATHNIETTEIYMIGFSEGAVVTDLAGFWYNEEIKAIAPYAGGMLGKSFPRNRDIPVYYICGTNDFSFTDIQDAYQEWVNGGHTTNNNWVSGVGHSFSTLNSSGPSPSSVYQWLASASFNTPVTSTYQSNGGSSGGSGGSNPTNGSGGSYPGNQTRTVSVSGLGNQDYYLYIPSSYNPSNPVPVMFAYHGQAGAGNADAAAQQVRSDWQSVAESNDFIVIAQVGTSASGSWDTGNVGAVLNAIINDSFGNYNIEQNRVYAWGFSAGGHLVHALALQNTGFFAAYGVSAGVLQALAGTSAPSSAARQIPVDIHVGSSDSLQPSAAQDRQTFQNAGWTLNSDLFYTEFSGGHTYSTSHLSDIWNNIGGFSLP